MGCNSILKYMGSKKLMQRLASLYAPQGDYTNGMISPLHGDCNGLPPIQLQVSAAELVRDDSVRFYEKFKGVTSIDLVLWDHVPHCHQIFGFLPEATIARSRLQSFIAEKT